MTPGHTTPECSDPQTGALLISYALGTLPDADAERFEHHLLHCSACQHELEAAAPALETLAATRADFVLRAQETKEDFESQYARLAQDILKATRRVERKRFGSWLENVWAVVWGRRWVLGAAGAVAFAILIGLRHGPEVISPPVIEQQAPRAMAPSVEGDAGIAEEVPKTSSDDLAKVRALADRPVVTPMAENESVTQGPVGAADQIVPSPETYSMSALTETLRPGVATEALQLSEQSVETTPSTDWADIALGEFHPATYSELDVSSREMLFKAAPQKSAYGSHEDETTRADSLPASRENSEAEKQNQQKLKADSTNARLHLRTGVAAFEQEDYVEAKRSLQLAYTLLPPSAKRDDVGLLLARVELLTGRPDDAKARLQQLVQSASDSSKKLTAQTAIAKIDSLERLNASQPTPK